MPTDAPIYDRSFLPVAQFEFVVLGDTHFILDPEPYAVEFDSVRAWPQRGAWAWRCVASLDADFVVHLGDVPHETAFSRWSGAGTLTRQCFDSIEVRPFDFLYPWTPKPFIPLVASIGAIIERIPGLREIAGSLFIVARKKREGVQ